MVVEKTFHTVDILVPISLDPFRRATAHQSPEGARPTQGFTLRAAALPVATGAACPHAFPKNNRFRLEFPDGACALRANQAFQAALCLKH
jgi:hypothetical protein